MLPFGAAFPLKSSRTVRLFFVLIKRVTVLLCLFIGLY